MTAEASLDHAQGASAYVPRFNLGDLVRITPPPGEWESEPLPRTVIAIHFREGKVSYDLQPLDLSQTIFEVDSCDVEPVVVTAEG